MQRSHNTSRFNCTKIVYSIAIDIGVLGENSKPSEMNFDAGYNLHERHICGVTVDTRGRILRVDITRSLSVTKGRGARQVFFILQPTVRR